MRKNDIMPFILPLVTIIALGFLFFAIGPGFGFSNPEGSLGTGGTDLTGMVVAAGNGGELTARIRISATTDHAIPEGSSIIVTIYGFSSENANIKRQSSMPIEEFIMASGHEPSLSEGELPSIGYIGPGYTGSNYTVDLSLFDIDRRLPIGKYVLKSEVLYKDQTVTKMERVVEV
jgi:hypothetical protein